MLRCIPHPRKQEIEKRRKPVRTNLMVKTFEQGQTGHGSGLGPPRGIHILAHLRNQE